MKYLEQRIEELEKEILKLKSKFISLECKYDHLYNCKTEDTSKYLNNYPNAEEPWYPPYPDIMGSWNDTPIDTKNWEFPSINSFDSSTYYPPANPEDVLENLNVVKND